MVAFSEVAPFFTVKYDSVADRGVPVFMATTLMASRAILAGQYALRAWQIRHHRDTREPMLTVLILHVIAACAYGIIAAASTSAEDNVADEFLHFITGIEVAVNLIVAAKPNWTILSFDGTHLAERLKLLTLIILGEGLYLLAHPI